MISSTQFGTLRLAQFRPDAEIKELSDWEFMDEIWVGEAVRFSEWLRLESDPDVLRSLAIDFSEFPKSAAAEVLNTMDLPIHAGMTVEQLRSMLGDPVAEQRFVKDRVSYDFVVDGPARYNVSCTVLNDGGLTYLVVMVELPGSLSA